MGLILASLPAVGAQDIGTVTLPGPGEPITWTDESGDAIASTTVRHVENDFRGYDEGWDPEFGYQYILVETSVVNESDQSIILKAYPFLLIDEFGHRHNRVNLTSAGVDTFDDDLALAAGESIDLTLAYQIPAHTSPVLFAWNPDNDQMHYIVLSSATRDNDAISWGIEATSTFTDDFMNAVASFSVTDITNDWTGYADVYAPMDGGRYIAVDVSIVNQTNRPIEIDPFDFSIALTDGTSSRAARVRVPDGENEPFRESVSLQSGEHIDVTMVFEIPTDVEPIAVEWKLDYSTTTLVMLGQAPVSPEEATPAVVATPS